MVEKKFKWAIDTDEGVEVCCCADIMHAKAIARDLYEAGYKLREAQKAYIAHINVGLAYERPKTWREEKERLGRAVGDAAAEMDAALKKAKGE